MHLCSRVLRHLQPEEDIYQLFFRHLLYVYNIGMGLSSLVGDTAFSVTPPSSER